MTQNEVNREVARATGETIECVRRLGFRLIIVPNKRHRPRGASQVLAGRRLRIQRKNHQQQVRVAA